MPLSDTRTAVQYEPLSRWDFWGLLSGFFPLISFKWIQSSLVRTKKGAPLLAWIENRCFSITSRQLSDRRTYSSPGTHTETCAVNLSDGKIKLTNLVTKSTMHPTRYWEKCAKPDSAMMSWKMPPRPSSRSLARLSEAKSRWQTRCTSSFWPLHDVYQHLTLKCSARTRHTGLVSTLLTIRGFRAQGCRRLLHTGPSTWDQGALRGKHK